MGKIYKRIWGFISRPSHIGGNGDPGIRTEGWFSASLMHGGDRGGGDKRCTSNIKRG